MAIFNSVSQALHFAFTIQAYEIGAESAMTKALRRIMMELGLWDEGEASSVKFEGLSREEVRAQCALIRAMVIDHLPQHQRWAIEARYELTIYEDAPSVEPKRRAESRRSRKCRFSSAKICAIEGLIEYLKPSFDQLSSEQLKLMVVRATNRRALDVGCRPLADSVGMNYRTFARAARCVRDRIVLVENEGLERLQDLMSDDLIAKSA